MSSRRRDPRALHVAEPRPQSTLVIYGIAHAGAGAAPWNPVAAAAPADIEVRAVRLPGRENRITVPRHATVAAAADELADVIGADAAAHAKPILLAGSCSGVLLGLATLHRLRDAMPVMGLVCLRPPTPDQVALVAGSGVSAMSSAQLRVWLRHNKLTPPRLLDNDTLFGFFEPVLRHDLALIDGYRHDDGPVSCPVYLVHTRDSRDASLESAWRRMTTGGLFRFHLDVIGDPLTEHPDRVAEIVGAPAAFTPCRPVADQPGAGQPGALHATSSPPTVRRG